MMTMLTRDKFLKDLEYADDVFSQGEFSIYAKRIDQHDQAQRAVIEQLENKLQEYRNESLDDMIIKQSAKIEQQAKEIAELRQTCGSRHREIERLVMRIWTLREALQTCQSRLGCGCGDILCSTCSAAYDLAQQALKEVS